MANTQFLTVSLPIRPLTTHKYRIYDFRANIYHTGAQEILDWCQENLALLKRDGLYTPKVGTPRYTGDSIRACLPGLPFFGIRLASMVVDALLSDVAAVVASYLEQKKVNPRAEWPTVFTPVADDEQRKDALKELGKLGNDLVEENRLRDIIAYRPKVVRRPIAYSRARDFNILYRSGDLQSMFVWLPLLPGDNKTVQPYKFDGSLIDLVTGEPFVRRSNTGLLMPVIIPEENGDDHWYITRFITPVMERRAFIKSAKLIEQEDKHLSLNISIAFDVPTVYEPMAYLGVTAGTLEEMAYAVVNVQGKLIAGHTEKLGVFSLMANSKRKIARKQASGKRIGIRDYRGQHRDELLHNLANHLIDIAKRHQAQIVLQDMSEQKGVAVNIRGHGKKGSSLAAPWRKLEFILAYKAKLAGVPIRSGMWRSGANNFCIHCGHRCEADKETHYREVQCTMCYAREDRRVTACVNIARRMLYRRAKWEEKGGYEAWHQWIARECQS